MGDGMLLVVGFVRWSSGLYKTYLMCNSLNWLPFGAANDLSSTSLLSRFWNFMSRFRLRVSRIRFFVSSVSRIFFRVWRRRGLNACQSWTFTMILLWCGSRFRLLELVRGLVASTTFSLDFSLRIRRGVAWTSRS